MGGGHNHLPGGQTAPLGVDFDWLAHLPSGEPIICGLRTALWVVRIVLMNKALDGIGFDLSEMVWGPLRVAFIFVERLGGA